MIIKAHTHTRRRTTHARASPCNVITHADAWVGCSVESVTVCVCVCVCVPLRRVNWETGMITHQATGDTRTTWDIPG